jgi:hypothetical protein
MSGNSRTGYLSGMSHPNEQQPEVARPGTEDPGRTEDRLYRRGEGEPPDNPGEADSVGAEVIGELRERRES